MYQCHECGSDCQCRNADEPTPDRCRRCGAVHSVSRGQASIISPAMLPVSMPGRQSPWMLPYTRPLRTGPYECRFHDVAGVLTLWWNGFYFQPSNCDKRVVLMVSFQTWRGMWGESR